MLPSLAGAANLELRVLDPHQAVIAGAVIEVRRAADKHTVQLTADEAGRATVEVELPAELRVSAPGFDPLVQRLEPGTSGEVSIRLRPATIHTRVDVIVRETPSEGPTTVGSALEIERGGARTVLDAVEQLVPSAFVTRRGVMGYGIATNGTGVVTIRGIGESPNTAVLIVVDGRPDFQGLMGHPLPDFYTLSDAGTVSITQGPASVLYGSNAMGGVIEVQPPKPAPGFNTRLTSSVGSYWTGQHRLTHSGTVGRNYYSLAAGIAHTNGERERAAFRNQDGSLTLARTLTEFWKLSLDGQYGHFHVEDPGPLQAPLPASYARVGRGGFSVNLNNSYGRTWGYARVFSNHGRHIIYDGFRSVDSTTGVRVHQNVSLAPHVTLDAGSDVVRYGGRANNIISGLNYGEHHISSEAGFSRVRWETTDRLHFNAGMRYENNSQFGGITVPEFGVSYRLAENYSLSAAIGRGFRNPTIRELYLFPAPNPLLEPEHVWNYQATLQANPRRGLTMWVTGYYADLSNLIAVVGRYPNLQLLNLGHALNRGVETNLRWQPMRRLRFASGYAYLRSTNRGPYIPAHKLNYGLDLDLTRAWVHFGGMAVGPMWANAQRTAQLGGFNVSTLKLTFPVAERWRLFAVVDNLFNHRYQVVAGYPMPGTNAAAGFDLQF